MIGSAKQIKTYHKLEALGARIKNMKWTPRFLRMKNAEVMAKELYDACMAKLLDNPDITESDAAKLLNDLVEQATVKGELVLTKFEELFTGTLHAMGISTEPTTKEDDMSEKKKLVDRVKGINLKGAGQAAGKAAAAVARPTLALIDGFKEGWKNG